MKSNLLMNFTVEKETSTVNIKREFNASLANVWSAWTEAEILDQWWAPAPFTSKTKRMDFTEAGHRLYAMVGPENQERWGILDYTSISPKTNFKYFSAFADKDENPSLPGSEWDLNFSEQNGITKVIITIYNESLERLEKMVEMGFQGGITMTLNYLEQLLANLKTK